MLLRLPDETLIAILHQSGAWLAVRACSREGRRVADAGMEDPCADAYEEAFLVRGTSQRAKWRVRIRKCVEVHAPLAFHGFKGAFDARVTYAESAWHTGPGCMAFTKRRHRCSRMVRRAPYLCWEHQRAVPFLTSVLNAHREP